MATALWQRPFGASRLGNVLWQSVLPKGFWQHVFRDGPLAKVFWQRSSINRPLAKALSQQRTISEGGRGLWGLFLCSTNNGHVYNTVQEEQALRDCTIEHSRSGSSFAEDLATYGQEMDRVRHDWESDDDAPPLNSGNAA